MKNVWIINAHEPYPFSEGKLNQSLVDLARDTLSDSGYEVIVVGAGPAGCRAARLLSEEGFGVLLLEKVGALEVRPS